MRFKFRWLLVSFLILVSLSSTRLAAEDLVSDRGLVWGANLGPSLFYDDQLFAKESDFSVGLGVDLFAGAAFNDRFALLAFIDLHWAREDVGSAGVEVINLFLGPVGHYFFNDQWSMQAGPGFVIHLSKAEVDLSYVSEVGRDRGGFGALLGVGYEFMRTAPYSIGASLQFLPQWFRPSEGGFSYVVAGGLGVSWY